MFGTSTLDLIVLIINQFTNKMLPNVAFILSDVKSFKLNANPSMEGLQGMTNTLNIREEVT